jgi:tetratricopeptide (TPR) repeat protein
MGIVKSKLYPAMQLSHKYSGSSIGDMTLGLGWVTMTVEGKEILWHNGGTGGYMSFMGFTKDGERGVVVLSNSAFMPDDIGIHLLSPKAKLRNPKPSIANELNKLIENEGIDSAIRVYTELKKNNAYDYNFSREELNKLGYRYLLKGKMREALAIFKINLEANPKDWNVYDSYAEALLKNNEKDKAVYYYKKSVELNPQNTNGLEELRKLGVKIEQKEKQDE